MQNLEVKDGNLTIKNTKSEIKKELDDSIANGKKNENTDIKQIAKNCTESEEDAEKVTHEFEKSLGTKKNDIVWLAYHQSKISKVQIKRTIC